MAVLFNIAFYVRGIETVVSGNLQGKASCVYAAYLYPRTLGTARSKTIRPTPSKFSQQTIIYLGTYSLCFDNGQQRQFMNNITNSLTLAFGHRIIIIMYFLALLSTESYNGVVFPHGAAMNAHFVGQLIPDPRPSMTFDTLVMRVFVEC